MQERMVYRDCTFASCRARVESLIIETLHCGADLMGAHTKAPHEVCRVPLRCLAREQYVFERFFLRSNFAFN